MFGQTRQPPPLLLLLSNAVALLTVVVMITLMSGAGTVTPALAATVTRSPTVVDHLGDAIPLTMYMRLQRQTQKSFLFDLDATNGAAELEEGVVVEDAEGNVAVDPQDNGAAAPALLPDEWDLQRQGLELPALGATTGKHKNQVVRNLPPAYGPRFGINRAVTLVANATLRAAGETLEADPARLQSDLAVRFSIGRGLQKESTWLPLATRHKVVDLLTALLARHLDAARDDGETAKGAAARAEPVKEGDDELAELQARRDSPVVHYLSRVTFYFGYQTGEQHRLTSFAIDAHYSPMRRAGIELHYIWDEHRPYNPNRALVLCSAASLLVAMMMVVVVLHPSSRSMLLFSQRIVAVREHE